MRRQPSFLKRTIGWLLAISALVVAAGTFAQGRPALIGVSEIQPGMKGYGLTVFKGTEPTRFDVEVIDVLHNFRPNQELILIRTEHPILEHAVTVAGMSGSPIYLDGGRLAGAYAYGFPFGKDPVVGATPIGIMLEEMKRPVRPDAFPGLNPVARRNTGSGRDRNEARSRAKLDASHPRFASLPPYRGEPVTAFDPLRRYLARHGELGDSAREGSPMRAETPVMLGGFTDDAARVLRNALEPFGLVALQASGGDAPPATHPEGSPRFVDGGAIGVQLLRGDISATSVGTVTHVGDRRLVAFGHPMMNAGQSGLPTSMARVLHILASQSRSFKIAEATDIQGALIHDRQSAIVVDRGFDASVVPLKIRLHGLAGAPKTEWDVEVADHRILTPVLSFAALANALSASASDRTDVVYRADTKVRVEGHGEVRLTDRGYLGTGPGNAGPLSGLRVFSVMEAAFANPFEETRIESAEIDLHLRFARDVVRIVDASVASNEVDPGSVLHVHVITQRLDEPAEVRILPVRIPQRAAGEELEIMIRAGDDVDLELPEPTSLDDLIAGIETQYSANQLVASLELPSRGLRFRGHVVNSLPPSALDSLQLANDSGRARPFETVIHQRFDAEGILTGKAKLEVKVRETPKE